MAASNSGTLQLYWDLASLDATVRLQASSKLSSTLREIQEASPNPSTDDITKDSLETVYSSEISYALKRLIRGLSSSRDGARQGFTLALAELLEFLKDDQAFTVGLVMDLIESLNVLTANVKGQEEREMYFARIFGLHAVVQSGLLCAPQTTTEQAIRFAKCLLASAAAKSYLSLVSYDVLVKAVTMGIESDKEWVSAVIEQVVESGMGTEGVWLVIVAQDEMKKKGTKFDWKTVFKGTWEKPSTVLNIIHKTRLANVLMETTFTAPKLHPIFTAIIANVFGPSPTMTLHEFWSIMDESLFNSSHDRKFIGFLVFQQCLEAAAKSNGKVDVGVLFSKSFLRCLINSLAKGEDAVLNKAAKATAKQISVISSSSREIGLQVVFQLLGKNGHQRFDGITRTKTVENIVSSLSESDVESYVKFLTDLVLSGVSESAEESGEVKSSAATRMWALDQLHSLLKAPKIPKSEGWIQRVLQFLGVHSLFVVDKSGNGVEKIEGEFSQEVRDYCRGRFFASLAEVNGFSLTVGDKKLAPGVKQNGEYWAYDLVQFILELDGTTSASTPKKKSNTTNGHVRPVDALEATSLEARNMAIKEIATYRTKVLALQKQKTATTPVDSGLIAQYKSFELLFLHVLLQVYTEPADAVNILNELKSCADLVFSDTTKAPASTLSKKRKLTEPEEEAAGDSDDEEPLNPVDVIIDILLSFLAKPSALFRGVVENVFKVFCPVLTASGLQLIFDILKAKSGLAGAEELFEEGEDDEDDEDSEDDDVMEIDASEMNGGDAEDASDDEESDDEENEESSDDEEEVEEADESIDELKNRLLAALGGHADGTADMNPDDAEDSDDERSLNDEEMEAFDEKLSAIFRERKKVKNEQRDSKQQVLHFKLRAVDLLEIFIKKQPTNPLILNLILPCLAIILETAESEESRELNTKMSTLVKTKLSQVKEFPAVDTLENGIALLKEIHELAAKASSANVAGLCSSMSLLVTRSIAHSHPEGVAVSSESPAVEPPSAKKKKKGVATPTKPVAAAVVKSSPVVQVYADSMVDFLTKKKSKVQTSLLLDLCNRHPNLGLQLLPDMANCIAKGEVEKGFKVVQAFNIMAACLQKLPVKENANNATALKRFQVAFSLALLESAQENEEKGMTVARIKELVKPSIAIAKRLKKALNNEALFADVKKTLETREDGVKVAVKGLLTVL
ncbi:DNA-directed DNA polymerase [Podochytrium sp. JEL0797]|nr:DNA-directed DNA polymerase [Podochytrium sp. JEL0797]